MLDWTTRIGSLALLLTFAAASGARAEDIVVDPGAACQKKDEDVTAYCTIQEAIDAAFAQGGGDVQVMPGVYRENLILREDVSVHGEDGVVIELPEGNLPQALVVAANDSGLANLTLRLPADTGAAIPIIMVAGVEDVELEELVLDGGMNRDSIGVLVRGQVFDTSQIRKSEIRRVEVGVLAEDTRFRITRCLFEDILRDGIYLRPPTTKGDEGEEDFDEPDLGDEDDLEFSGFNRFRNIGGFVEEGGSPINENDAFLLRNTTGATIVAQLNDWGIYETNDIAARLSSAEPGHKAARGAKQLEPAVFEPYLGKSIFPGSVFARLRDAADLTVITNAAPRLLSGAVDTGIAPVFDAVSKLYSFTFINPGSYAVRGAAPGYLPALRAVLVGPGEIVAANIDLVRDGLPEGEPIDNPHTMDQDADGVVSLSELLRVVQFYNASRYHCDTVGEDGFAVGDGLKNCPPHAADYAPQDWSISLSETLRSVQFFNSGGYYPCPGSEDGYCPGNRTTAHGA